MDISKEELKQIKEDIFEKNINEEDKKKLIDKINEEIEDILSNFEEIGDPIDE